MKKILTLLALTVSVPSFAASLDDWMYAGGNKDYAAYFKSVERTGDLSWTLLLKVDAKAQDSSFGIAINHTEISCYSKTYRVIDGATYARDGRKIADMQAGQASGWKPLARGNFIYKIAKELCETLTPATRW